MIRRVLLMSLTGTVAMAAVVAFLFRTAKVSLRNEVRQHLASTAQAAALNIDAEKHKLLKTAKDARRPEFVQLRDQLRHLMRANKQIRFAYTMAKGKDPNHFQFIIDAQETRDDNGNGRIDPEEEAAHVGEPYDVSHLPELRRSFEHPTADREPARDQWGTFLSGYAPIRDRKGQAVAILGIDMDAHTLAQKEKSLNLAGWVTFLFLSCLVGFVSFLYAQRVEVTERNLHLLKMTEQHNRALAALNEIASALSLGGDLKERLETVMEKARVSFQADAVGLYGSNPARGRLQSMAHVGLDPQTREQVTYLPLSDGPSDLLSQLTARPVLGLKLRERREPWAAALSAAGFDFIVLSAMRSRDQITGVVYGAFREGGKVEVDQYGEFLNAVASQVGIALDNAKLEAQFLQAEKMAALGELVAGVAHEINNPVGFIQSNLPHLRGYLQGIQEVLEAFEGSEGLTQLDRERIASTKEAVDFDFLQADLAKLLTSLDEGSRRIAEIVGDLQTFARSDHARLSDFDLHQSLEAALDLLGARLRDKVSIHREYGNLPRVEGYPNQLGQVFINLLANAQQAMGGSGNLWIRTWREDSEVCVSLRDDGPGISLETMDRIFDPFFTTKPVGQGTGLGLSISYAIIVDRHRGQIWAESTPGKGTTFHVRIPVRQSE